MNFDELLDFVVKSGDRDKYTRLHTWVAAFAEYLDLVVSLKEVERDLAKPDHGVMLPGTLLIVQGRIMTKIATLKEMEDAIRKPTTA